MEEVYNSNHIIKGKRGDIYKGHVVSAFSDNRKITINNTFWDVTVSETFDADTNQTKTSFYFCKESPKWLNKLMKEVDPFTFRTSFKNDNEDNNLTVNVNQYHSTYEVNYMSPGMNFKEPRELVWGIKHFKKIFSAFHKKLKKTDTSINNYKLVGSEFLISDRFFNEFDIALATDIKGLPF